MNPNKVGIDLVELKDIEKQINNLRFINKILSEKELQIFNSFKLEKRKIEFLAGRFAAKEALFKADNQKKRYREISILISDNGAPYVDGEEDISISITHTATQALSIVIIAKRPQ